MNSKAETTIHDSDIDIMFETMYTTIMTNIRKFQAKGSGWTINSVIEQNINVSKHKLLSGSSYIRLQKELNHSIKGLKFKSFIITNALSAV